MKKNKVNRDLQILIREYLKYNLVANEADEEQNSVINLLSYSLKEKLYLGTILVFIKTTFARIKIL